LKSQSKAASYASLGPPWLSRYLVHPLSISSARTIAGFVTADREFFA
jgi:hypothetical protein